jgi:RNA polymerase sigma-70 factor (ECF subfamily)
VLVEPCEEAIRLARLLSEQLPEQPEVMGALALMLLHHSRRAARDRALDEQDRSLWRADEIAEGTRLIQAALRLGSPGTYQLQAAIAAVHAEAPSFEQTDWRQIVALYAELSRHHPSEVVELNRAVAASMVDGPDLGLALLERLSGLADYQPFQAARADLLRRAGRRHEAAEAYRRALLMAPNEVARELLARRLREVTAGGG